MGTSTKIILTGVVLGLLGPPSTAFAQRYIRGGRALDHNLQVGSRGINPSAPVPPINRSSRFISGNVTGGAAFQGNSPIRDSSQLFLNLPSSNLNNFRRDSLSVGDIVAGRTNLTNDVYYDRSSTVVDVGGLSAGLNTPGTSIPQNTYVLPRLNTNYVRPEEVFDAVPLTNLQPVDLRVETFIESDPLETRVDPQVESSLNPSLLRTNLFGPRMFLPSRDPVDRPSQTEQESEPAPNQFSNEPIDAEPIEALRVDPDAPDDSLLGSPLEQLIAPSPDELSTRLETQFDNYVPPIPLNQNFRPNVADTPARNATNQSPFPERTYTPAPEPPSQAPTPPPAGVDVFTDMQVAVLKEMQSPELGPDLSELLPEPVLPDRQAPPPPAGEPDAEEESSEDPDQPQPEEGSEGPAVTSIRTFVGTGETQINQYMARAENDLKNGDYYTAAATYAAAANVDPNSPLPLLGRGHALIAAGEYVNAARYLVRAITLFPNVARFPLELGELIQRPAELELRRADLEERLQRNENHSLRFVLGYIEYFTGLPQFGTPNMTQAAEHFPNNVNLQKFISMLDPGTDAEPASDSKTP